jgi:DNA polymerase-4
MARSLADYARGDDERPVEVNRELKSVGHDQTFAKSISTLGELFEVAKSHSCIVARAIRSKELVARTVSMTLRFDDQTGLSRSQTLPFGIDDETAIAAIVSALMESVPLKQSVRLVGVYLSNFLERGNNAVQLSFDIDSKSTQGKAMAAQLSQERQVSKEALRDAVDEVRAKFGNTSVGTLSELGEEGLEIERQRGSHAFGPKDHRPSN